MSRYIDADALKKRVSELIVPDWTRTLIRSWVDDAPTVDAVPVVRCKDCVKRPPETARNGDKPTSDCPLWCGYCFGISDIYGGEFFCGAGARE